MIFPCASAKPKSGGVQATRRGFLRAMGASAAVLLTRSAWAGGLVPGALQAELMVKVSGFDKNLSARAGSVVVMTLMYKSSDPDSTRLAKAVASALSDLGEVAGKPKQVELVSYTSTANVADRLSKTKSAVLYFSTGLESEMSAIADGLRGMDILTYGGSGALAEKGAVVGFELEEGKPKLWVNLARAKAQNVSLRAELLKLARIVG